MRSGPTGWRTRPGSHLWALTMAAVAAVPIWFHLSPPATSAVHAGVRDGGVSATYVVAFLHLSWSHLVGNVLTYLVCCLGLYAFARRVGLVGWLVTSVTACLFVVPPVTASLVTRASEAVAGPPVVVVGFSTVVAGVMGVGTVALPLGVRERFRLRTLVLLWWFAAAVAVAATLLVSGASLWALEWAVLAVTVGAPGAALFGRGRPWSDGDAASGRSTADRFLAAVWFVSLFVATAWVLLSTPATAGHGFATLSHVAGFVTGVGVAVGVTLVGVPGKGSPPGLRQERTERSVGSRDLGTRTDGGRDETEGSPSGDGR